MKIAIVSDTHGVHERLRIPKADVLVFCGDFSARGWPEEVVQFNRWLGKLTHEHIVVVAGNHDRLLETEEHKYERRLFNCHYLRDSSVEIGGLRFYGTPWQPRFNEWAWNLSDEEQEKRFALIPEDTDVLVTHCPPHGILDEVVTFQPHHEGSMPLRQRVDTIKPKLHCFGHIHEGHGKVEGVTTFVNGSVLNDRYELVYEPTVVEL